MITDQMINLAILLAGLGILFWGLGAFFRGLSKFAQLDRDGHGFFRRKK